MQDVYSYINSASLSMLLVQYSDTNTSNQIVIDEMSGSGNTVRLAQGAAWSSSTSTTYSYDGLEGGGHYIEMDLYGNNNHLQGHQTNQGDTTGHDFNFHPVLSSVRTKITSRTGIGQKSCPVLISDGQVS